MQDEKDKRTKSLIFEFSRKCKQWHAEILTNTEQYDQIEEFRKYYSKSAKDGTSHDRR